MAPGQKGWAALHSVWWSVLQPLARRMSFPPAHARLLFDDQGMSLAEFGIRGRVIHTPGHTLGSVSLLLESGEAFVGDLGAAGRRGSSPRLSPAGNSPVQMVESWRKLLAAGARTVYPGHGPAFRAEAMRELLSDVKRET
jgi:glyoxylase-like metal-dependent hydrolase (beta-lactamase superfamily II)